MKLWLAKLGSERIAKSNRDNLEKELGRSVLSSNNALNYKYIEDLERIENKY